MICQNKCTCCAIKHGTGVETEQYVLNSFILKSHSQVTQLFVFIFDVWLYLISSCKPFKIQNLYFLCPHDAYVVKSLSIIIKIKKIAKSFFIIRYHFVPMSCRARPLRVPSREALNHRLETSAVVQLLDAACIILTRLFFLVGRRVCGEAQPTGFW